MLYCCFTKSLIKIRAGVQREKKEKGRKNILTMKGEMFLLGGGVVVVEVGGVGGSGRGWFWWWRWWCRWWWRGV